VSRLKGEVASPAELKTQMEEMKTELDKKMHAVEQTKLFNRSIMFAILTAVLMIFFTSFVKPYFTGSKNATTPPVAAQSAGNVPPVAASPSPVITLPAHLEVYILGAGGIAGECSIVAAFIVRKRQK
jgi:hypothetical protein